MKPYCIAWMHEPPPEALLEDCPSCPVVAWDVPRVCPCECQTCKRAWWRDGRPIVRDGKIVRETDGEAR